jgi:hypothetical protein
VIFGGFEVLQIVTSRNNLGAGTNESYPNHAVVMLFVVVVGGVVVVVVVIVVHDVKQAITSSLQTRDRFFLPRNGSPPPRCDCNGVIPDKYTHFL